VPLARMRTTNSLTSRRHCDIGKEKHGEFRTAVRRRASCQLESVYQTPEPRAARQQRRNGLHPRTRRHPPDTSPITIGLAVPADRSGPWSRAQVSS
jgi:hypothetical protein